MRHLKAGRKLGRNATHRLALFRNLALALFRHERIITTVEKAKEARRFVERLITLARRNNLHARRLVAARLGSGVADAEVKPGDGDDADHRTILTKLFDEIAPRYAERPGGYTRVIKRTERRLGDGGKTAFLELLKEGETKIQKREPGPAPRVEETPPQQETPASETPPAPEGGATPPAGESQQPPAGEGQQPQGEAPSATGQTPPSS
jgi:large subunit ribosomal protein L17